MCASVALSNARDPCTLKRQIALSACRARRAIGCIVICDADAEYLMCAAFSASGMRRVLRDSVRGELKRFSTGAPERGRLELALGHLLHLSHSAADDDSAPTVRSADVEDAVVCADVAAEALADAGITAAIRLWLTREEIDQLGYSGAIDETLGALLREHMVEGVAETPVGCACALIDSGRARTVAVAPIPASLAAGACASVAGSACTDTEREWERVGEIMTERVTKTARHRTGTSRVIAVQISRVSSKVTKSRR